MNKSYHAVQFSAVQLPLFTLSKICATCRQEKNLTEFTPSPEGKHGCVAHCRPCMAEKVRAKNAAKRPIKRVPHPGFKFCIKCGQQKPLDAFEDRRNQCEQCRFEYRKARYHRIKNTPEYKAYQQQYHATPEFKKSNIARVKRFQQTPAGKELKRQYSRKVNKTENRKQFDRQRRLTPEYKAYHHDYSLKYAQEYPERVNEVRMRRVARKQNAPISNVSYKAILERDGYYCYICDQAVDPTIKKGPASLHFDHIIPLARDGHHVESNIAPTHACCNMRKNARLLGELTAWDRRGPDA